MTSGQARAAAVVRILAGVIFIAEGWSKIAGPFVRGSFGQRAREMAADAWPFWRVVLESVVVPNAKVFAWIVAAGELAVGIGLLLGLLTRVASFSGALLMLTILLGQSYAPGSSWDKWVTAGLTTKFALLLLLLLGIVDAGRAWSVDAAIGRGRRGRPGARR